MRSGTILTRPLPVLVPVCIFDLERSGDNEQQWQWEITRGKSSRTSLFNGNRTFGFSYSTLSTLSHAAHVFVCIAHAQSGLANVQWHLLHRRTLDTSPLFYRHFKEHIRTLTLASATLGGCYNKHAACARPARRCSFDIDMHYVALIHSPRAILNVSYCKTGTTDLYASPG